jgi:hypothetical protein
VCAWCGNVRGRSRWIDVTRALALIEAAGSYQPKLTHGICPSCFAAVSAKADSDRRACGPE